MKNFKVLVKICLCFLFLFSAFSISSKALADSFEPKNNAAKAEQAAQELVREDKKQEVKDIFGLHQEGAEVIDQAREEASNKLKEMAYEAKQKENLKR